MMADFPVTVGMSVDKLSASYQQSGMSSIDADIKAVSVILDSLKAAKPLIDGFASFVDSLLSSQPDS